MNDKFKLIDIVMDALPENSPWQGNIKELVAHLIAAGVTVQKHGRWISEKCNHKPHRIKNPEKWAIYKCSACGYSNGRKQSNYCPHCGAIMDEGEA